jgi:homoserine dehydrogenase
MKMSLVIVGFGHVARRFVTLLEESRAALAARGIEPVVIAVATRHHGSLVDPDGLSSARLQAALAGPDVDAGPAFITNAFATVPAGTTRVLIETTTLNVATGEPAISHIGAGFASGAHVITANKGPIACAYRTLAAEARAADRAFLFEGTVMDGMPIFNLVRETMPGVTVNGFRGVLNSTTNYMLTAMEHGASYAHALADMQQAGVAEADPSHDVDGWDAAVKAVAIANVLLNADLTPGRVAYREGISAATAVRALSARAAGRRLKLVASGSGRGREASVSVRLDELSADDPLAILDGQANAIELDTWPLGRLVITQRDGGLEKTAYALLADLFTIATRAATSPTRR